MSDLFKLVEKYTIPLSKDSEEGVDVYFFKVKLKRELTEGEIEELKNLSKNHKGDFADMNPFDGKEHSYIEVGAWIGDQGMAMRYIGLGEILGFWRVMTPNFLDIPESMKEQMAGAGMVSLMPMKGET